MKHIVLGALVGFFLLGCSGKYTEINTTKKEITQNKDYGYISFHRVSGGSLMGEAFSPTIVQFDENYDTNFIATLSSGTQIIKRYKPGKYFFYLSGGENDDMIEVNVEKNRIYYVTVASSIGIGIVRYYFKAIKYAPGEDSIYSEPDWTLIAPDDEAKKDYQNNLPDYLEEIKEDFTAWKNDADEDNMKIEDGYPLE